MDWIKINDARQFVLVFGYKQFLFYMSRQHIGILLTVVGTIFLAISVKVIRQYYGEEAKAVDRIKKDKKGMIIEPTEVKIIRSYFWLGLALVSFGSLLQW